MAPPFVLESLKTPFVIKREPTLIHSKKTYNDKVKTMDWQYRFIPPRPGADDVMNTMENKCRIYEKVDCICDNYVSSYKVATDQLHLKDSHVDPHPIKHLFNYYGYTDDKINEDHWKDRRNFPTILNNDHNVAPEYLTTMQTSYTPPFLLMMHRLRAPQERFMMYRRMKGMDNPRINTQFQDDRQGESGRLLRCARIGGRSNLSYNFMTGRNNDGTLPKEMNFIESLSAMKNTFR